MAKPLEAVLALLLAAATLAAIPAQGQAQPVVTISTTQEDVPEGASGFLTITRTGSVGAPLDVRYVVEPASSAVEGNDFQPFDTFPMFHVARIPSGSATFVLEVAAIVDGIDEPTETLHLSLAPAGSYTASTETVVFAILDMDFPAVRVRATDAVATERPQAPLDTAQFTITRQTASPSQPFAVGIELSGQATPGADYRLLTPEGNPVASTVTFAAGVLELTVVVEPIDDVEDEFPEVVQLRALPPAAGAPQYTPVEPSDNVDILDDDLPEVSAIAFTPTMLEGGGAPGRIQLVRTVGEAGAPLTVQYNVGGSAIPASDYKPLSGFASFPAGAAMVYVDVEALEDQRVEGPETVLLTVIPQTGLYRAAAPVDAEIVLSDNEASDRDHDGSPDIVDNCGGVGNSVQSDLDGDGTGDACDADIDGDLVADRDLGDGEPTDNCPLVANTDQDDEDEDGTGDACDAPDAGTAGPPAPPPPPAADTDEDGIADVADNCERTPNRDQADMDEDGEGDLCDNDLDGDGILQVGATAGLVLDNCPSVPNPAQVDRDNDDLGDACDDSVASPIDGDTTYSGVKARAPAAAAPPTKGLGVTGGIGLMLGTAAALLILFLGVVLVVRITRP